MEIKTQKKDARIKVIYTAVISILLVVLLVSMISYIYKTAEQEGFEKLHIQTKEIKEDIELQMVSDRENLITIANMASRLHSQGRSYDLLFNSFESIGLIKDIAILTKDNKFLTKNGSLDASAQMNFEDEIKKGMYISGKTKAMLYEGRDVVRSAVPIMDSGKVVGVLYGVIELEDLKNRYAPYFETSAAYLYILEQDTGKFIVDTRHEGLGNISLLDSGVGRRGYSYIQMSRDMAEGKEGYSAFLSNIDNNYYLVHYAPLSFGRWQVMVAMPESDVFFEARKSGTSLLSMFIGVVVIMLMYISVMISSERKNTKLNQYSSKIRKQLLETSQNIDTLRQALELITEYANSRSAFFGDTDGEKYGYIRPKDKKESLSDDDREYIVSQILNFANKIRRKNRVVTVTIDNIKANHKLKKDSPKFYEFMKEHNIKNLSYAAITNKKEHMSILGCINPKMRNGATDFLSDIAVCFSMAIYNRKYLNKTETVALTDPLTDLNNRMAYKRDIMLLDEKKSEDFACVYIDVNELHVVNNQYGHAAGDGMLVYVANAMKKVFKSEYTYRIGGDEFVVFTEGLSSGEVNAKVEKFKEIVQEKNYYVSVGVNFIARNIDTGIVVSEAEKAMYLAKAEYYQKKEEKVLKKIGNQTVEHIVTGIKEFDASLSIMSLRYHGIYCVSLKNDKVRRILMPEYLKPFAEKNDAFSKIYTYYVQEVVSPDYQRAMLNFLNYDALKRQLSEGITPSVSYKKVNGENKVLSIHKISEFEDDSYETMWVFEKED